MQTKDWLVKTSKDLLPDGVLYEPRVYSNVFRMESDNPFLAVQGFLRDAFVNGEQFPVTIKYLTASVVPAEDQALNNYLPTRIQSVAMRIRYHDQWYMAQEPASLPVWSNQPVALPDLVGASVSNWKFDMPVVLSARDSLQIRVSKQYPSTPSQFTVAVSAHGVGFLSGRPYFFYDDISLDNLQPQNLITAAFANYSSEPIVLEGLVFQARPDPNTPNAIADIANLCVEIKQIGNGTNADWLRGPPSYAGGRVSAVLLGTQAGRAIVHRLPGNGWLWRPGEGIEVECRHLVPEVPQVVYEVAIAAIGYIAVQ